MKIQPPLWIFSPFGQPSYWTTSSHSPFGSILNTRPKGMSTHHRFPSRSKDGPSRKLSTCAPPRLGSDHVVRRFLRNFAGSEVKGRAWMRLIFWNGLCIAAPQEARRITQVKRIQADRKSTRLNSSHLGISYAVFCLKKKKAPSKATRYIYTYHSRL